MLVGVPDGRKKLIAFQTSGGAVSGFFQRYIQANPNNNWEQMKAQLSVRFSDVTDAQMALSLLRQTRQNKNSAEGVIAPAGAKVTGATIRTWLLNKIISFLAVLTWKTGLKKM